MKTTFRVSWQINVRESHLVPAIYTCNSSCVHFTGYIQPAICICCYIEPVLCECNDNFSTPSRAGHDRLTCPAQPGHGGKRRDSPEGRISSAITDLIQGIDHEPTNLNETQHSQHYIGNIGVAWGSHEIISHGCLVEKLF